VSPPRPLEQELLALAERALDANPTARIEVLEAYAARQGGWDLDGYRALFPAKFSLTSGEADSAAARLEQPIERSGIHPSIAVASLARPQLTASEQRTSGAYYTDFRLAKMLAVQLKRCIKPDARILDPAAGTGILLVALALELGRTPKLIREIVAGQICAADLSVAALRGCRAALASLTQDLGAVAQLDSRLRVIDSLLDGPDAWSDVAPSGFGALIGNPPWEKLKLSRHEHLRAAGDDRHYGEDYEGNDYTPGLLNDRERLATYLSELAHDYPLSVAGEPDLYKLFIELNLRLAAPRGGIGLLVPAGLIRSQGTKPLRERLFSTSRSTTLTVFENRARFFAIDTRFKFLAITAEVGGDRVQASNTITLSHANGTEAGVTSTGGATTTLGGLRRLRADLTIPEVRGHAEWELFERLSRTGIALGSSDCAWKPEIAREVDMTRDRHIFQRNSAGAVPLVEGRMVHQYRSAAKSYVTGTGRRSVWDVNPLGIAAAEPQFFVRPSDLPPVAEERRAVRRAAFCDVTGQTNERTVLASIIEPGSACGNKVPTVLLRNAPGDDALYTWTAVANSFVFDWLARRIVTTTLNYFLLESLPFPAISTDSLTGRRLARLARQAMGAETNSGTDLWDLGRIRAELDVQVAAAYGLDLNDLIVILADFDLLDRGQRALPGEPRSTVTVDVLLAAAAEHWQVDSDRQERVDLAHALGAVPYVPSSFAAVVVPSPPGERARQRA